MAIAPADSDALIELVNDFQQLGHPQEAAALFDPAAGCLREDVRAIPQEFGGAQSARLDRSQMPPQSRRCPVTREACRGAGAQEHAIIDTLAETYFQRGEYQKAIDAIARCIELEPKEPHHRKQMERFKEAIGQRGP